MTWHVNFSTTTLITRKFNVRVLMKKLLPPGIMPYHESPQSHRRTKNFDCNEHNRMLNSCLIIIYSFTIRMWWGNREKISILGLKLKHLVIKSNNLPAVTAKGVEVLQYFCLMLLQQSIHWLCMNPRRQSIVPDIMKLKISIKVYIRV